MRENHSNHRKQDARPMLKQLISNLQAASTQSGRPIAAVALEMLQLRLTGARLGFSEYFDFRLYETDLNHDEKM